MKKISTSLQEIINANPFLQFGLSHKLLNLTSLANFLKPLIEIRTKKDLQSKSALIMALSRLQKDISKTVPDIDKYVIENLIVHSDLCTLTYVRHQDFLEHIGKLYHAIQKNNGYIALSQGTNEVTIIVDADSARLIKNTIKEKAKNSTNNLAALSIKFSKDYYAVPGLLYYLIQQIYLQGINIREISSTFTEIIFYVDEVDLRLLFDTIYSQFGRKNI